MEPTIRFNSPTLPPLEDYLPLVRRMWSTGQLTNGPCARALEERVADYLGVPQCVALASCTSGLILTLRALGLRGAVILPSFTFFATAHAVLWNGLEPVFADIDPANWNISLAAVEEILAERQDVAAILPVHVFGNPCDTEGLRRLAAENGAALLFDAAHAMGADRAGKRTGGTGNAEVFSLSPTKLLVGGEGGMVTTSDPELAGTLRHARDYGNEGDYDPVFVGLNARMSELHAALALGGMELLEENVAARNAISARYRSLLGTLPGITFQAVDAADRSTHKDITVRIDPARFGMGRDALAWHLREAGIETKLYYHPPVHRTRAYWERWGRQRAERLPVTEAVSGHVVSLPIWSHMDLATVDRVCESVVDAHCDAERIGAAHASLTC